MLRGPEPSTPQRMSGAIVDAEALRTLVNAAQGGSKPAADQLVREHEGWVRAVVYGVTGRPDLVDDIAQQVWTQVFERLDSLADPARLRSWLYSVARNAAIDAGQARRRRAMTDLEVVGDSLSTRQREHPDHLAAGSELRQVLLQAVQALPALYREPFVLRHLEDWSYAEIGALLEMPEETVETRLVRARRLLREMLKGKIDHE